MLNRKGEIVLPLTWNNGRNFTETGLARVSKDWLWGWINRSGEVVIPPAWRWDDHEDFGPQGLARVRVDRKWGWIDTSGEFVIPPIWDEVAAFDSNNEAMVVKDGKFGLIDMEGNQVVPVEIPWPWKLDLKYLEFDEMGMAHVSTTGGMDGMITVINWLGACTCIRCGYGLPAAQN